MSSRYKRYNVMQRISKELRKKNPICEKCYIAPSSIVHHKDFSVSNHNKNNFLTLCQKCHMKIHIENGDIKAYGRNPKIYKGKSIKEWSKILNVSKGALYSRFYKYGDFNIRQISRKIYGTTFQKMGEMIGLTRERVRQLHNEGKLKKRLQGLDKSK